jgi:predicted TIM-barrel fold metal-dependent hydrolase
MGYIDADSHVVECEHTWDFFDPAERDYRPRMDGGFWAVEDLCVQWPSPKVLRQIDGVYPDGAVDLRDPPARIRYMDDLGVDVQVLFPTYLLNVEARNPVVQAALSRSYNRWLAETTADSGGRLAWIVDVPALNTPRALEELEFGKEHGAVGVYLRAIGHHRGMGDPVYLPIYEKAQDLDLTVAAHVGGDYHVIRSQPSAVLNTIVMPVPAAFGSVLLAGLTKRFPRLRWGFVEAGATWLPFVLQETFRAGEDGTARRFGDWRAAAAEALAEAQLYVAVQMDDDLPYLLTFAGEDRLVHGTDFGHLDLGSDPNGLHMIASRADIDPIVARKMVNDNARSLYGIDAAFTPAPPPSIAGPAIPPRLLAQLA